MNISENLFNLFEIILNEKLVLLKHKINVHPIISFLVLLRYVCYIIV